MKNLVSVIIPCYNGAKTIDRAIRSVYEQNYPKIELIVVDDGSTDQSKEKILAWNKLFADAGYSLKYVYQKNQGPGGAINTALQYVTGEFLMLLDADDEYLEGAIVERIDYFKKQPECGVVRSNGWRVKGDLKYLFLYDEAEKQEQDVFTALLRGETNNWAGSYMVRTDLLFEFYPDRKIYPSRYGQNLQILLPAVFQKPCGYIDKPLMNYILQESSLSQTSDPAKAKQKDLRNAEGYLEIRRHMVDTIVQDEIQRKYYHNQVSGAYWRSILHIAAQYRDKVLMKQSVSQLKQYEKMTMQDRICYEQLMCPPAALLLRIWYKFRRVLGTR